MNIVVCVKHVFDTTEVRINNKTNEIITRGIPTKISDYDRHAIEEAVRIMEKKENTEINYLSLGTTDASKSLKEALAMGGHKAYLVNDPDCQEYDPITVSYILMKGVENIGKFDLIICGETSEDGYNAQVGPALAERLRIPHAAYVNSIEFEDEKHIIVKRDLEDKIETLKIRLPAVVTVNRMINEPRLPTTLQVMKVPTTKINKISLNDIGISDSDLLDGIATKMVDYNVLKIERKQILVENDDPSLAARELINYFKNEGCLNQ